MALIVRIICTNCTIVSKAGVIPLTTMALLIVGRVIKVSQLVATGTARTVIREALAALAILTTDHTIARTISVVAIFAAIAGKCRVA